MKRESILFKLNILFALALIATLLAGFSFGLHHIKKDHMDLFFKSRLIVKEMRITHEVPTALLEEFAFKQIKGAKKKEILKLFREKKLRTLDMPKEMRKKLRGLEKHRRVLHHQGQRYLHLRTKQLNVVVEDTRSLWACCPTLLGVFVAMLLFLVTMYVMLRKSLLPLKELKENIIKYGEGKQITHRHLEKKDEVSLATNAFFDAASKVEGLSDSRQLFIRNIFHELNTPVTKGKILAEIVDEPKTKEMLDSIFTRLSTLLKELAQMEQITSQSFTLSKKTIRIQELIDEASDLLYLDEPIISNITDETMEADFATMSIVFKNLIDNALKYATDLRVAYTPEGIMFSSKGEPLKRDLSYYTQAFSKEDDRHVEKGFGLGLYIVHEILSKHGMRLAYTHENGLNRFTIVFQNNL